MAEIRPAALAGTKRDIAGTKEAGRIASEKWVVRQRKEDGTLRHVITLTFKPSERDLLGYGPGSYMVQKAGPKFSKAEKITVSRSKERKGSMPQAMSPETPKPSPPLSDRELLPPQIAGRESGDMEKHSKGPTGPSSSHIRPRISSSVKSLLATWVDGLTKAEKDSKPDSKIVTSPRRADVVNDVKGMRGFEPLSKGKEERRLKYVPRARPVKTPLATGNKVVSKPAIHDSGGSANAPSTPPTDRDEGYSSPLEDVSQEKTITCRRCGTTLCKREYLGLYRDEVRKCDYCICYFCTDCYPMHRCPESKVCFYCKTRFSTKDDIYKAEYCRKIFCSPKCVYVCRAHNKDKEDCQRCGKGAISEESEENDEQENSEEGDFCAYCGAPLDEDTVDCSECESVFCTTGCFRRYHRKRGVRHRRGGSS